MSAQEKSRLGVGLYSLADAARITGEPAWNISRWVGSGGIVPRRFDPSERTLTFVELMEVFFIHLFRAEGVSFQAIRKTSEAAARKYGTAYPFTVKRFDTDGKTIFATLISQESGRELIEDLQHSQLVFRQIIKPFFRKLDYRGTMEVARYWPLEKSGRVVLDPEIKFGQPIDAETGVPTRVLYDAVSDEKGQDVAYVAKWFGVPPTAVHAAVAFEKSLAG